MADSTNEQRIAKIEKLLSKISPLNYQRIFLETRLHFSKEKYFKSYDEKGKSEIIETEKKLNEINTQLAPLFAELRKMHIPVHSDPSFRNKLTPHSGTS